MLRSIVGQALVKRSSCLQPHIFAKGDEFKDLKDTINHVSLEEEAVRMVGGEIAFTQDITFSSSALINQYLSSYPNEVKEYLADFSKQFSCKEILQYLKKAAGLKVLVLGETIIDEYQYCEVMGKSGKEPVLATRYLSRDRFGGGVLACANHLAGFCDQVDMLTFLGEGGDNEAFVRSNLKANVQPTVLVQIEIADHREAALRRKLSRPKAFRSLSHERRALDQGRRRSVLQQARTNVARVRRGHRR